ncbi:adenylate/guanylate cyclase domain-containing protein [Bradyrhizobium sp. McL0615]|uniref:adenylate/guanylate cyclase domain-containing protein n=1 Tax=Bradyrhizobium sp. McL0615 TaxID=3415673 RepID=UPI003CF67228
MTAERVERRLAAVLAADVAGYSRLMGVDEEGTLARLKAVRKTLVDPTIANNRGRIVKTTGDGMLVEFASAVDAVRCAVEVQRGITVQNEGVAQDTRIEFRIGVHIGDIIIDDNDIFGDGVNVAARLEGIAEPGGVCMSNDAYRQVRGKVDIVCDDMGQQHLKNIAEPMQAWRVRLLGHIMSEAGVFPAKPSIAVLPFQNMSGDPEQEYFADGMVEDIITELSRFKSLFVIARNSSFTYKGTAVDIKRVGRDLGVRYVLEGSVRKSGERVRITGQLIDASTGAHLWADKFDGFLADVFELQDEVTHKVVASIAPKMEQAEIERASRKQTERLDSYDLFLRGMALSYQRRTASNIQHAYEAFKSAAELDETYAAAHIMVAWSNLVYQAYTGERSSVSRIDESLRFAEKARALGEDDAFVKARAGHVFTYFGQQHDLGLSLVDEAVELNCNLAPVWYSRGAVSVMCEMPQQAIQSFEQMARLSPRDPLIHAASYMTGWAHFSTEGYSAGYIASQKAVQIVPDAHSLAAFAANALRAGRVSEAREAAERLLKFQPGFRASHAHYMFPIKSVEIRDRIQAALRDAGIPEY